jgi:hypothetical protein
MTLDDKLNQLQEILIDEMIRRISTGEATAADLGAARQLLRDNGIQAVAQEGSPLHDLVTSLPFQDEADKIVNSIVASV